jgi:urease accessory protein
MTTTTTMGTIMPIRMATIMHTDLDWLLPLSSWLSPAYPVGAFSYSHGLEWAVESDKVCNRIELEDFVATVIEAGAGWSDLVLIAAAWRAAAKDDDEALDHVAELALALRGTGEMALETGLQGTAFVTVTRAAWSGTKLDALAGRHPGGITYPIAVAAACAGRVPLAAALAAYGHAIAANLISAGIRLVPLGQTDGQRALATLTSIVTAAAARAAETSLDDLGMSALGIDLCSMRHETQYTRLFRS